MKAKAIYSLGLIVILFLTACSLVRAPQTTDDSQGAQDTAIALAVGQTQTAAALAAPPAAGATVTPGEVVPVATIPMVSVSVATNCRTGPGEPYEIVGALMVGQQAEVIGRNQSGDTWIIRLPSNTSVTCWLWGYYATVVGDTAGLMVYTPPPTPTPAAGFTVAYSYLVTCEGGLYAFRFLLNNTGALTYHSYRVDVTDGSTAESRNFAASSFPDGSPDCTPIITLMALGPGDSGGVGSWSTGRLSSNPTGHAITAVFRLCTEVGLGGTCEERSIYFTP